MAKMIDYGERRLISEILENRYGPSNDRFGDDVAIAASFDSDVVVVTTDPAPEPVAWTLGLGDFYDWGWLLSAINLSDLAAAGAEALCLLTSLTLPANTDVSQFLRLLDGIDDCARKRGAKVIGGNLKESNPQRIEATAVGVSRGSAPLSRRGARPGDLLVAFGPTGRFWSFVFAKRLGLRLTSETWDLLEDAVRRPNPQMALGLALRTTGLAHSCTDASDGIYGSMISLTVEQGLGITVEPGSHDYLPEVRRVAELLETDPLRLALGFGNLELVASIAAADFESARTLSSDYSVHMTVLGTVGVHTGVWLRTDRGDKRMNNFDNERFTVDSQFTTGLDSFAHRLRSQPILADD